MTGNPKPLLGRTLLVAGASSQIGLFLLPRLLAEGAEVIALSRRDRDNAPGLSWRQADLIQQQSWPEADALIHLAFLPLLPRHIEGLARGGVKRIIALSSTSMITKAASSNAHERNLSASLVGAENETITNAERQKIAWTLFRPTLIYGAGMDHNVCFIQGTLRRFGFFPLIGKGSGRRQPVHAEDLASACVAALENERTYNRVYELAGGETLSYRQKVERIATGMALHPRFLCVPQKLLEVLLSLVRWLPGMGFLTPEMAGRMNLDLTFDNEPARRDFGYHPRPFTPIRFVP